MDDTDWEDIAKRVSKQIKINDGRVTYIPGRDMEDDSDPTASSSRDKRASEPPDEQATISKKLKKDHLGAACINCPDLDDVGCTGFGKSENGLTGQLSGYLRIRSHSECSNMAKLKEELHTHGSRCVLITENVRDAERRIIENIQRDKHGQHVSLTAKTAIH